MAISAGLTTGLELDQVECSPLGGDKLAVRLHGRWPGRPRRAARRVTLIVEDDGRRHRFPAIPQPRSARLADQDAWTASFAVPAWLQPALDTSASLAIGEASIPVPPPEHAPPEHAPPEHAPPEDAPPEVSASEDRPSQADAPAETVAPKGNGSAAPAAEQDGNGARPRGEPPVTTAEATIAALRNELHERAGAIARLHGVLADVQAEVEASSTSQARLQSTQDELRRELEGLRGALDTERTHRAETESRALSVAAQQASLEQQLSELSGARDQATLEREELNRELSTLRTDLATSEVAREAAASESAGLRAEVERLGRELVGARRDVGDHTAGLAQAEALLAEARALTASLREE
jgi:predicted  nucleic acid-binding Zn-ribbon protein